MTFSDRAGIKTPSRDEGGKILGEDIDETDFTRFLIY